MGNGPYILAASSDRHCLAAWCVAVGWRTASSKGS